MTAVLACQKSAAFLVPLGQRSPVRAIAGSRGDGRESRSRRLLARVRRIRRQRTLAPAIGPGARAASRWPEVSRRWDFDVARSPFRGPALPAGTCRPKDGPPFAPVD